MGIRVNPHNTPTAEHRRVNAALRGITVSTEIISRRIDNRERTVQALRRASGDVEVSHDRIPDKRDPSVLTTYTKVESHIGSGPEDFDDDPVIKELRLNLAANAYRRQALLKLQKDRPRLSAKALMRKARNG